MVSALGPEMVLLFTQTETRKADAKRHTRSHRQSLVAVFVKAELVLLPRMCKPTLELEDARCSAWVGHTPALVSYWVD